MFTSSSMGWSCVYFILCMHSFSTPFPQDSRNQCFDYSATIMHNYLRVLLPPALGPSRLKGGHGSCNARYNLSACCAHEGETDTDDSAPESVDPEEMLSSPSSSRKCRPGRNVKQSFIFYSPRVEPCPMDLQPGVITQPVKKMPVCLCLSLLAPSSPPPPQYPHSPCPSFPHGRQW